MFLFIISYIEKIIIIKRLLILSSNIKSRKCYIYRCVCFSQSLIQLLFFVIALDEYFLYQERF